MRVLPGERQRLVRPHEKGLSLRRARQAGRVRQPPAERGRGEGHGKRGVHERGRGRIIF